MIKTLIKKQFRELFATYFFNKKTGKMRSVGGTIGLFILFSFVFLSVAGLFSGIALSLAASIFQPGFMSGNAKDWTYFSIMGLLAIIFGTFGSVFNTFSTLYQAKDNELLLSMPIKPSYILITRMLSVFILSALYSGLVWIPTFVISLIFKLPSVTGIIYPILLWIIISMAVTVLTCLLGWIVALIASKLKNKSIIVVIISVIFFGIYYYCCMNLNSLIEKFASHSDEISGFIKIWIYPVYQLGLAGTGDTLGFIIYFIITAILFAICCYIMSKTFIKIVTTNKGNKKVIYVNKTVKANSVKSALLRRELKHFTSSATYMLNSGLGLIFFIVIAVLAFVKQDYVNEMIRFLASFNIGIEKMAPVFATSLILMIISMNCISSPSVSLEGKNLWIIRSLPVSSKNILEAKENLHVILNIFPSLICTVSIGIVIKADVKTVILMVVASWIFIWFTADLGIMMNLLKPNLDWTNEAVPIKQSISTMIVLFGGWIISIAISAIYFFVFIFIPCWVYLIIISIILAVAFILINRWIKNKGTIILERL